MSGEPANIPYVAGYGICTGGWSMPSRACWGGPASAVSDDGGSRFMETVISQYANSPTLVQLVRNMDAYINPRADMDAFYSMVWNVDTAQGFGLDIWGRIVGVSRNLQYFGGGGSYFGFRQGKGQPFNQAPMRYGYTDFIQNVTLADADYRTLIMLKAMANISSCTAPALNQLLRNLFAQRGRCYVQDTGAMTMHYVFEFRLTATEQAIFSGSGVFPRPAAVGTQAVNVIPSDVFGFAGSGLQPLGSGTFFSTSNLYHVA